MIFSGLITCAKLQVCGNSLVFHRKALQEEYWFIGLILGERVSLLCWFNTGTKRVIGLILGCIIGLLVYGFIYSYFKLVLVVNL